ALALLSGQAAPGFRIVLPTGPSTLWEVPGSVPSELLERRPDIAAAERRVAAANADVGVACAAFYPRVRLTGLAGFQSIDALTLFNAGSRVWAFGPSVELPIFTGGRNRAQLAAAQARFENTVAEYRQTVLAAFREVEDQLSAQLRLAQQLESE